MTPKRIILPAQRLLHLSDLHLDKASPAAKSRFFAALQKFEFDAVLITGDTSVAAQLCSHLFEISVACGDRPAIFTTGNHDYYGSSFKEVDEAIRNLCSTHRNLVVLGRGEIIEISRSTALVGHRGWYDGLAGYGAKTRVKCPDRYLIADFKNLGRSAFFRKLQVLGQESAEYFRQLLPLVLTRYRNVFLATHVPPFTQAVRYDDKGCEWSRQPFFTNQTLGRLVWGVSRGFPTRRIHVRAGHTHSAAAADISRNLSIEVAGPGLPSVGRLLSIS